MSKFNEFYKEHEMAFVTFNCIALFPILFVIMVGSAFLFKLFE